MERSCENLAIRQELTDAISLVQREEAEYQILLRCQRRVDAPNAENIREIEGQNVFALPEQHGRVRVHVGRYQVARNLVSSIPRDDNVPQDVLLRTIVDNYREIVTVIYCR